ncbi:phosphatidylglycerophosphatase A, partial [Thermococcus sp. 21S9]|nr:phosphatidylglycerophosphatase A [Thermococcus sp. 21S9]
MKAEEILRRLEPKCITLEKMLDTAMELYIGEDTEKIREKLKSLML